MSYQYDHAADPNVFTLCRKFATIDKYLQNPSVVIRSAEMTRWTRKYFSKFIEILFQSWSKNRRRKSIKISLRVQSKKFRNLLAGEMENRKEKTILWQKQK